MRIGDDVKIMLKSPRVHFLRGEHMPEWASYSVKEAAERTGYHEEHLRRLIREGKIEAVKIGPAYLIRVDSLEAYIKKMESSADARGGPKGPRRR